MRTTSAIAIALTLLLTGCLSGSGGGGGGVGGAPITDAGSGSGGSSGGISSSGGTSSSGASSGATSSGGGASSAVLDAIKQQLHTDCDKSFECCTKDELAKKFFTGAPEDVAACKKLQEGLMTLVSAVITQSIEKNRVVFNNLQISTCLSTLKAMPCAQYASFSTSNPPPECQKMYEPQVAKGGACNQDIECKTGKCSGSSNKEGVCEDKPKVGDACEPGFTCGDLECVDGKCAEPKKPDAVICDGK